MMNPIYDFKEFNMILWHGYNNLRQYLLNSTINMNT